MREFGVTEPGSSWWFRSWEIHQRSLVSRSEQQSKRRLRLALRGTATYRNKREPFSSMPHNPRTSYTRSQQPRGSDFYHFQRIPSHSQRFPRKPRDRRETPESQLPPVDLAPDHPGPRPTVLVARTWICACCGLWRIPVIVATPSVGGGCDGTGSTSATESWAVGQGLLH